jgi:catechol 2,3-dioxygenase-like lactoylglutathione lyase family enzyme
MDKSNRRVKGLGEVSIRVKDLDAMHKFYEEVVGLEVLRRDESFVFFKVAEGYGGHTQNLALFEGSERWLLEAKSEQLSPAETTLHHIALNVALEDFESERMRLEGLGLHVNATVHEWLHVWRHGATVLPRPRGESAGVCLLRCKRGISRGCTRIFQQVPGLSDSIYS